MKFFSITGHLSATHGISASIPAESRADAIKKFFLKFPKGTIDVIASDEISIDGPVSGSAKEMLRIYEKD